jgi:hypothetical protein
MRRSSSADTGDSVPRSRGCVCGTGRWSRWSDGISRGQNGSSQSPVTPVGTIVPVVQVDSWNQSEPETVESPMSSMKIRNQYRPDTERLLPEARRVWEGFARVDVQKGCSNGPPVWTAVQSDPQGLREVILRIYKRAVGEIGVERCRGEPGRYLPEIYI